MMAALPSEGGELEISGPAAVPRPCIPVIVGFLWPTATRTGPRGGGAQPHSCGARAWSAATCHPAVTAQGGASGGSQRLHRCLSGPGVRWAEQAGQQSKGLNPAPAECGALWPWLQLGCGPASPLLGTEEGLSPHPTLRAGLDRDLESLKVPSTVIAKPTDVATVTHYLPVPLPSCPPAPEPPDLPLSGPLHPVAEDSAGEQDWPAGRGAWRACWAEWPRGAERVFLASVCIGRGGGQAVRDGPVGGGDRCGLRLGCPL